jgi:hypothetical protein
MVGVSGNRWTNMHAGYLSFITRDGYLTLTHVQDSVVFANYTSRKALNRFLPNTKD